MFTVRDDEPDYAFLEKKQHKDKNQYGKLIELVEKSSALAGQSLNINNDPAVGDNPDRYKQHGFHFTADNCIACHACEAACSEKNDNPPHLSFRSVGYVEGGTYPAFKRLNISMACNHCDNPVCLKGCPTRAYTKFAEYGAVLQDPDICFGCGYCTWVCPYNAPQLDPIKGQVSKCNMCVDRLEVGLKPACVSACLGGALEFGVVENTPKNREQAKITLPGFPTNEITHPNIRFQQVKSLPREMTRTDSIPIKYHKDNKSKQYKPIVDTKKGLTRHWNLDKLHSREDPLVIFTLITQAVIGAFILLTGGSLLGIDPISQITQSKAYLPLLFGMLAIETFALVLSTMHLGKPHRFYRAFNNLRYSPVSREVAGVAVFFNCLAGHIFFTLLYGYFSTYTLLQTFAQLCAYLGIITGPIALYFMHKIYRIPARPYWNHWQVLTAFYGNMLTLGSILTAMVMLPFFRYDAAIYHPLLNITTLGIILGLTLETIGHIFHARDLRQQGGEGSASYYEQSTKFGYTWISRNILLILNLITVSVLSMLSITSLYIWYLVFISIILTAIVSRALFYVLVIPTTMPGAFFWKNKGFQEHARETGLANMPQVGVVPDTH